MKGGDFSCDFILDEVTHEDMEEDEEEVREESGSAILKEPGPGLTGASGKTLTREYTGTVIAFEGTVEVAATYRRDPEMELVVTDLSEEDSGLSVP